MKRKRGFTLVELIVVIAVIGILAAVLIPTFSGATQSANKAAVEATADTYRRAYLAIAAEKGTDCIPNPHDGSTWVKDPFTAAEVVEFSGNQEDRNLYLMRENIQIDTIEDEISSIGVFKSRLVGIFYFDARSGYYSYFDARNNKFETAKISFNINTNDDSLATNTKNLAESIFGIETCECIPNPAP